MDTLIALTYLLTYLLTYWPLMGGLLHLVQRRGAQSLPRCTKCNSPPINGQCTNFSQCSMKHEYLTFWKETSPNCVSSSSLCIKQTQSTCRQHTSCRLLLDKSSRVIQARLLIFVGSLVRPLRDTFIACMQFFFFDLAAGSFFKRLSETSSSIGGL